MFRYVAIRITVSAIVAAGLLHLVVAGDHFAHSSEHANFSPHGTIFVLIGAAQLAWAYAFWRGATTRLYWAGLALSGGVIVLWGLTQVVSVPMEPEPSPIDLPSVLSKASELIGFSALVALGWHGLHVPLARRAIRRRFSEAVVAAMVVGVVVWGTGHLAEDVVPGLGGLNGGSPKAGPSAAQEIRLGSGEIRFECRDLVEGHATAARGRAAAFLDYDNNGDLDIVQGNMTQPTLILSNMGDGSFQETRLDGLDDADDFGAYGIAVGDYNLDGFQDIYLGRAGMQLESEHSMEDPGSQRNILLENRFGKFEDVTERAGVGDLRMAYAVRFADYDGDGYLDIFVVNVKSFNVLYRNNGDGTFTDVAKEAGVRLPWYALDASWGDYDGDGDPDLYVTGGGFITGINPLIADLLEIRSETSSSLFRNNGDGTFTNVTRGAELDPFYGGLAGPFADFNNDGRLDLYSTYWNGKLESGEWGKPTRANRLYMNTGQGKFKRLRDAGLDYAGGSMSATVGDFDNDGFLDVYLATGGPRSREADRLYRNNGDGTFSDVTERAGVKETARAHGVVTGDYDKDGRLDIYISSGGMETGHTTRNVLCRNVGKVGNWLAVELPLEKHAIMGAMITLTAGQTIQVRQVGGGAGFGSVNSPIAHFGLGDLTTVDRVTVRWPDGHTNELTLPPVNTTVVVPRFGAD